MSANLPEKAERVIEDTAARQSFIVRSIWFTVPGAYMIIGAAYAILPPLNGLEEESARLLLAIRWLLVAMLPYVAVCMAILSARLFEGPHNPLLAGESERLKIQCRVMQNTLEQLVWFALCVLAVSTYLSPAQARLVPIVCTFFAGARIVYWWGYFRDGTLGRAPGVQLTFALNIFLLVLALILFAKNLVW